MYKCTFVQIIHQLHSGYTAQTASHAMFECFFIVSLNKLLNKQLRAGEIRHLKAHVTSH